MSDASQPASQQTLGQRIDAVLQPLYAEAEQHRTTLNLIKAQVTSLQEQSDAATAGLAKIESRMAQVVCSLADQEPIIAAVVTGQVQSQTQAAPPAPVVPATPEAEVEIEAAAAEPEAEPAPQPDEEALADEPEAEPATEVVAAVAASSAVVAGEPVPLDLDPETDKTMVEEAASLLAGGLEDEAGPAVETETEVATEAEPEPKPTVPTDIAAVARRAAAAAQELHEKASNAG